jgi:hypothetical protein
VRVLDLRCELRLGARSAQPGPASNHIGCDAILRTAREAAIQGHRTATYSY